MEWIFKKYQKEKTYNFLYVSGHQGKASFKGQALPQQVSANNETYLKEKEEEEFRKLLALASSFSSPYELFVLLKYSPALESLSFIDQYEKVGWDYELRANDFDGMGVDKGFKPVPQGNQDQNQTHKHTKEVVIFPLESLEKLMQIPEEDFSDAFSAFSIFGLRNNRKQALMEFLESPENPGLESFLEGDEVFIHLKKGKEVGYFNAFLLKSKKDLENQLKQHQQLATITVEQKE